MKQRLILYLLPLLLLSLAFGDRGRQQEKAESFKKPAVSEIENRLVELINQERLQHNLSPLKPSPELQALAKAHSQDMAEQNQVTHSSSNGKSYADRLAAGQILYREAGENVGFSETFVAELIHQSFMESPEHRETILEPDLDYSGIGIIYTGNKGYYITQDFILSHGLEFIKIEQKDKEDQPSAATIDTWLHNLRQKARAEIQQLREEKSLDPFVFIEEADEHAERVSDCMAKAVSLPPVPEKLQQIQILLMFITAGSLESALPNFDIFKKSLYNRGGLGVAFGRNREYPGGAVFITLLLFIEKKYSAMTAEELNNIFLKKINIQRSRRGIRPLRVDARFSREAESLSRDMTSAKGPRITAPARMMHYRMTSFLTQDPQHMPQEIEILLLEIGIRVIGLGIVYKEEEILSRGNFYITILY